MNEKRELAKNLSDQIVDMLKSSVTVNDVLIQRFIEKHRPAITSLIEEELSEVEIRSQPKYKPLEIGDNEPGFAF